jgi:hypothetical protein
VKEREGGFVAMDFLRDPMAKRANEIYDIHFVQRMIRISHFKNVHLSTIMDKYLICLTLISF